MTLNIEEDHSPEQEDPATAQVSDFLRRHPRFLLERPKLLAELELGHDSGNAVSLIEHQVRVLRGELHKYQRQLAELVTVARENEGLTRRLHRLTLHLMDARTIDEVVRVLQDELRGQFLADAVELKLFFSEALNGSVDELGPTLFCEFLEKGRPTCGSLDGRRLDYLFGAAAGQTGSAALVPLRADRLMGVLAIGSRDQGRFHPGKGVDFLQRLGEIVSHTLQAVA
jgi:uncharacterized protein YigA (DUF484 family)